MFARDSGPEVLRSGLRLHSKSRGEVPHSAMRDARRPKDRPASYVNAVTNIKTNKGDGKMDTAKMYDLPKLGYDYHALAPVISEDLLRLHHAKHHAAYVNGANTIL